jgi:hypothetical protein
MGSRWNDEEQGTVDYETEKKYIVDSHYRSGKSKRCSWEWFRYTALSVMKAAYEICQLIFRWSSIIRRTHAFRGARMQKEILAENGFDPLPSGLWARRLCYVNDIPRDHVVELWLTLPLRHSAEWTNHVRWRQSRLLYIYCTCFDTLPQIERIV